MKIRGLDAIDKRSAAAQALLAWKRELVEDLGGEGSLSAQQAQLVELAVRNRLYLDTCDAWIMERGTVVNARKRALFPIVTERLKIAEALTRTLQALGLERRKRPGPSLREILAAHAEQAPAPAVRAQEPLQGTRPSNEAGGVPPRAATGRTVAQE